MPYFKDKTDNLHWLDDSRMSNLLPEGCIEITEDEGDALRKPTELTYVEKRLQAYPPIQDYIDGVVKGDQEQVDAYIAACLAVKEAFPKDI